MKELITQKEILVDVKLECNDKCVATNKYGECMYQCLNEHKIQPFLIWGELGGIYAPGDAISLKFRVKLEIQENIRRLAIPTSWVKLSLKEINNALMVISWKGVDVQARVW